MNHITANTLLKTLEEPPGAVKFILATEAAHQLLPTIRSRCLGHTMVWPDFEQALAWLGSENHRHAAAQGSAKKPDRPIEIADLRTLLRGTGGRPADVLQWAQGSAPGDAARHWQALPKAMARGEVSALTDWSPASAVDALQKLCHDMWAVRVGASPRFFSAADLPVPVSGKPGTAPQNSDGTGLYALAGWSRELNAIARTVEHPYNAGLLIEALVSRARTALNAR